MSKIDVYSTGGGTALVSNPDPVNGEDVILNAIPNTGATLDDIVAFDIGGYPVALYVQQQQTITWRDSYGKLSIYVTFSEPKIHIYIDGDGTAYVSNEYPVSGETVTLYCDPDTRRTIKSIVGYDENGNIITFSNKKEQEFIWTYDTLDIYVTFGKELEHHMPIWMYPMFNE